VLQESKNARVYYSMIIRWWADCIRHPGTVGIHLRSSSRRVRRILQFDYSSWR